MHAASPTFFFLYFGVLGPLRAGSEVGHQEQQSRSQHSRHSSSGGGGGSRCKVIISHDSEVSAVLGETLMCFLICMGSKPTKLAYLLSSPPRALGRPLMQGC